MFWVDPSELASVTTELADRGRVATREVRWRTKEGRVATVLYTADTIEIDGERCVLSVAEDITARKQAEARHRAVLRALPDWIFVLSADGVFLDFHAKEPERLAAPPETFLGKRMHDVLPPDIADGLLRCFERAMSSEDTATLEYSLASLGEVRFFEARVVRCDTDKVLSIVRDITERRRAELQARELRDELAHVGRVTTLAALTGTLAHEINQPLAAIMTNAQAATRLIAAPVPDLVELRAALADIVSDNQRAADVVRRLRTLLKKDTSEYAAVNLNASIDEVIKVLQSDIVSRRIMLDLELAPNLPRVLGDRVQLQQVMLNLLMNAFEALENVAIKRVILRTDADDSTVRVSVIDHGVGLTDEQLPRMFEPFYTTKADGMGLGLAICQTIMNAHDGTVAVQRNVERGTTFSFSLPSLPPDTKQPSLQRLEIGSGFEGNSLDGEDGDHGFHRGETERKRGRRAEAVTLRTAARRPKAGVGNESRDRNHKHCANAESACDPVPRLIPTALRAVQQSRNAQLRCRDSRPVAPQCDSLRASPVRSVSPW